MTSNQSSIQFETETNEKEESSKEACVFIKPRKNRNVRKRTLETEGQNEEEDSVVIRKQKTNTGGFVVSSKEKIVDGTKDWARDMNVYKSSGEKTNVPSAQDLATWENTLHLTDEERIQKSKNEEKILSGEDAEHAEKIYRGLNNYTKYVDNSQQHTVKGAGIQQGPQRISSHIRWSARFDYQPDVCKDYKETGYCGYGDSCKFLHDRGDYKTGWELEKEWEDQQRLKRMGTKRQEENYEIQQEEDVPFACFICRKPFVDPVVTKCHHYFCEKCALSTFKKDMKCQICGTNTFGSFSIVDKKTKEKLQKRYQMALEKGEIAPDNDESNTAQQDDPPQNRSDDP